MRIMNALVGAAMLAAQTTSTTIASAGAVEGRTTSEMRDAVQVKPVSKFASVNGLKMYYEIYEPDRTHADRPPMVLLHGGLSTIATDFGGVLSRLAATRRIIAIEQMAHGHTADIPGRPLTYEAMTDDTAALLKQLGVRNADLFGFSMGGAIALQLAKRYSDLVGSVIFAGAASYAPNGQYPDVIEAQKGLTPDALAGSPYQRDYARVAPRPGDWPKLVDKIKGLDKTWRGMSQDDVRAITAPTLLIIGDADIVKPEHTVEMFRLLGGGVAGDLHGVPRAQLAILPGTTHIQLVQRVDWLVSMVTAFADTRAGDQKR
jgi:pimeloyl-ACP methyl ester carboxylesterase